MHPQLASTGMGFGMNVLGGEAPPAIPDALFESATDCFVCEKKFHAFRRKHRCRACGNAVCGSCARTHKVMPSSTIVRFHNEPVRVCDGCVRDQNQLMLERRRAEDVERARARQAAAQEEEERQREAERYQRERDVAEAQARRELRLRALEEKHLGPRPDRRTLQSRYSRSLDDCACHGPPQSLYSKELSSFIEDAEKRSVALTAKPYAADGLFDDKMDLDGTETLRTTVVQEADECAICLETMDVGTAIYTTACGHSFHWSCLKEIQKSDSSNYDKCPSCRATMTEMQVKKQCDHPRVRFGHRFCRDCGAAVTEADAKPRGDAFGGTVGTIGMRMSTPSGPTDLNHPVSYRASSHGALVRCPQCHIQMRVLPHMYNMRVACPSGHMFLVQVAGPAGNGGANGGYGFGAHGGLAGPRMPPRGLNRGYPGSHYRPANAYPEL
ncbi:and ph domain-containing protein 6-like [Plasmopara halstedii]|uniref:And ph domain-containing protein 6-like n=1 Tax=Plasmopara halstedii TaxID=4781 RepID=A0A0P1AEZ4_PLAHL|nr:and ph domain-containing protein 6-like [Plasmopara halstedii]CEG39104.1 and ph domain-containing protein 6-like [Plasmopara halstedii]|eukprot:XP_024575473.1 and ph domain-containing protein 6-like [Plasmopara halstedii]